MMIYFFTVFIPACFILSFYVSQVFKTLQASKIWYYLFWVVAIIIPLNLILQWTFRAKSIWNPILVYSVAALVIWLFMLITATLVLFLEDIQRICIRLFRKKPNPNAKTSLPSRRKFIGWMALGLAMVPFASMIYAITKGRYNYKVWKYTLYYDDLPEAFEGYTLTQISDVHCGSFDNREKIQYGIDLINQQKSDVILFTGDLVNNIASEILPWKDIFGQLRARDGVFSTLGNHDYGDYSNWTSPQEKAQNFEDFKRLQKEMGWDLLLNEHRYLEKDGQRIALVGVENWGYGHYSKHGDLEKALEGVDDNDFKILMSHDPTHWEYVVLPQNKNIHLTLSGHTHGMQLGIEIEGFIKWSPGTWQYKYWAGMYEEQGKRLNVNRGFGYLAFPGRLGVWPEITVIELRKTPTA
ncbi:metallophosphoesterase [Neisseria montereyensis]|uniref:Metallophosphoesterase n=1 Tax=Neisseria montereyensis TaxID=2973938 RepID=A0ABT2FCA3_9NEIS|nr:metallophosphoesterase [Neisseria montereyensis]MCS4533725.1 metallophosphoesterase [Neisseria montereyensis]